MKFGTIVLQINSHLFFSDTMSFSWDVGHD